MAMNGKRQALESAKNGVDRISDLPIALIHHVLSSLSAQDLVRTCVLSKYWRTIWSSVPTLCLEDRKFRSWDDYFTFGHTLLLLRNHCNIHTIKLHLLDIVRDITFEIKQVNVWIQYANRHNVRVLDLVINNPDGHNVDGYGNPVTIFELSPSIFTSKSLLELSLSYNSCLCLPLPSSIYLPALLTLQLSEVTIQDGHLLDLFISTSPFLQNLALRWCIFKCSFLTLSACQLRNLVMEGNFPSIRITASNLVSLNLEISQAGSSVIRTDGKHMSLTYAMISIREVSSQTAAHLISMVKHAQSFSLKFSFPDHGLAPFVADLKNSISILNCIQTPFCNLKQLKVETMFCQGELVLIHYLLKHSPQIRSLILVSTNKNWDADDQVEHFEDDELWSNYELSYVKLVEIKSFRGSENELNMVKFILKKAPVLEKLIITTIPSNLAEYNPEMMNIGSKLLTYPRASSSVGILFSQGAKRM